MNALVIGASRGLGAAVAEAYLTRGWHVVGTVRPGPSTPLHALRERWPAQLDIEMLDINAADQLAALRSRLGGKTFDLLLINAGITNDARETIGVISTDEFERVMVTNALSPLRTVETLGDVVTPDGTIAFMSSGQGSIANNDQGRGIDVYRASKAALNMLVRSYANRHAAERRTLLLLAPGWIRTDLGGDAAPVSVEEAIPVLVDTIEAQRGTGGLHYIDREGRPVPW